MSYLRAGGSVLLMTRCGTDFISDPERAYLGITWAEDIYNTISDCISAHPGLVNMTRIGTQSYVAVFDTSLATNESRLLLKETATFSTHRGLGVLRDPAWGGHINPYGGQFAFLSGRPSDVRVAVYDAAGREVAVLLEGKVDPGLRRLEWSGTDRQGRPLPSGIYFYRVKTSAWQDNRKMTKVR
jgi:hypothetical protein